MASYIQFQDRWWNNPGSDIADSVGKMFGEMKKNKTKEELSRTYKDALSNPELDAKMTADEGGNISYSIGKKAEKEDSETNRIKQLKALLSMEDDQGTVDTNQAPVIAQDAPQGSAFDPKIIASALMGGNGAPGQVNPQKPVQAPQADALTASSIDAPAVIKQTKKSPLQGYMDKLQKSAPEGYEVNPNFILGGSKDVYIKKSGEFVSAPDAVLPDGVVPSKYKINPKTGKPEAVEFEKKKDKPLTDEQAKASGFVLRTEEAEKVFKNLDKYISDQGLGKYIQKLAPNPFKKKEQQQYEQAQRDFVNAVLRRESGAAISEKEFENAREQYFPQPGDKAEVIAQKAANRKTAIKGLKMSTGPAMTQESSSFKEGTVYEDSQGNRAVFRDGQWQE